MASLLGVPAMAPVAAAGLPAQPRLEVTPQCLDLSLNDVSSFPAELLVTGRNFIPGETLRIEFEGVQTPGASPPPPPTVLVSPYGSFDFPFPVTVPNQFGQYRVRATDVANSDLTISVPVDVPCRAQITLSQPCGVALDPNAPGPAYDLTIAGKGWGFGVSVVLQFEQNGTPVGPADKVVPDQQGLFTKPFQQPALPAGTYQVKASQAAIEGPPVEVFVEFLAPCAAPTLTVEPTCGPAGSPPDRYQLTISASGFIPGRPIVIAFDPGPNTQYFLYQRDGQETGALDPGTTIDPFLRPDGVYSLFARQYGRYGPVEQLLLEVPATFTVPCTNPKVTIDAPDCGPPAFLGDAPRRYDITVRGTGFAPEGVVTITFDPSSTDAAFPPETFNVTAGGGGDFTRAIDPFRRPVGTYTIVASQPTRAGPIEAPPIEFLVPCAPVRQTLQRDPVCGPEAPNVPGAYSIQLGLAGYIPGLVELTFDAAGVPETQSAVVGENGRLNVTITANGRPAGTYRIRARQRDVRERVVTDHTVGFTVPCPTTTTPTIRLDPPSRAPGFVITVIGTGFVPNTVVTLRWDRGIGVAHPMVVQADASGAFQKQVLLYHHDFAGLRNLQAGTEADPAAFPTATARLLVVAGQGSPPSFGVVDPFSGGQGPLIVFRR